MQNAKPLANGTSNGTANGHLTIAPDLHISSLDTRSYRALTLPNQLDVLLISDSASDKAAASLNVSVGSFSDPDDLPGLAHFLEHMLFLGTEKYPEEGSYSTFLAENGGASNAYTASENTNFHFYMLVSDRDPNHPSPRFHEALDRFSQFFTAPLFTESATDRELNAVDSEHEKNLQNDDRRLYQLRNSCANPKHPFSKFGTGSKETLYDIPRKAGIDTRSRLLEFYHAYYSANLMSLCIIAPYPLDVLQKWAVNLFSAVPNHNRKNPCERYCSIQPLLDEHCGLIFQVESVCDIRVVEMMWMTETYIRDFDSKPGRLVSALLGDESEGSLLSLLKKRGWCDSLSAGPAHLETFGYFMVSMTLTNEGTEHIDEIIAMTYQYIRMLKRDGVPKRVFDEEAGLGEITFRFRDREEPINLAMRMSAKMPHLPPAEYLSGQYLIKKFDEEKIENLIHALTPERCNIVIAGKFFKCEMDKREKWYDTAYRLDQVSEEQAKKWNESPIDEALHLPPANEFIPSDFNLVGEKLPKGEQDLEGPLVIEENEHFVLRHKLDRTFCRPRAKIILKLMTPIVYASPWHLTMATLMAALLEDSLTEYSYPAERAGFVYELEKYEAGFVLVLDGYSHRIDVLLNTIAQKLVSFKADATRFEIQKDLLERKFVNFEKDQPYGQAMYNINYLLEDPRWHIRDYLRCLRNGEVTLDGLDKFAKDALRRLWVNSLVCGNISADNAISMIHRFQRTLGYEPLPKVELPVRRVVDVPVGRDVFMRMAHPNDDDNNSAIEVFFQVGPRGNPDQDVHLHLLADILDKPTFHELRTVQQLGYIVFEGLIANDGVQGLYIIIQSTVADPDELLKRIDKFLKDVRMSTLQDMTQEKFDDYVNALVARKSEPDRTIARQAGRFWSEIDKGFLMFDRRKREIEALQKVTKEQIITLFDDAIAAGGCRRKRVVSQIYAKQHPFKNRLPVGADAIEVKDALDFRRSSPLYPVVGRPY